jgi:dGTPase
VERLLTPITSERLEGRDEREFPSSEPESAPGRARRSEAQRDRDRILYAQAFHRLAYVTQVTAPEAGYSFHNRLGHSLKVAQVGRRNAERLQSLAADKNITGAAASLVEALDLDAVEASCLAHDLGHPPFGHIAEQALHEAAKGDVDDGFEGNAQSFRIVARLAVRASGGGLNLTRQTLDGLLKYPWAHRSSDPEFGGKRTRKWGYYRDERDTFAFARAGWPEETKEELPEKCLAAEIMEWADDLTYAVHDVDDFFRAGLIPLDRLRDPKSGELKRFANLLEEARDADPDAFPDFKVDELVEAARQPLSLYGPGDPYEHTISMRASMREFGSKLITDYLEAFTLADDPDSGQVKLLIDADARCQVQALNMLVGVYVIRRPGLAVVQHGQKRVISDLFRWYSDASVAGKDGDRRLFPPGAKERLEDAEDTAAARARVVVDLISGLTESSAIQLHHRLSGGWTAPTLDATAQIG